MASSKTLQSNKASVQPGSKVQNTTYARVAVPGPFMAGLDYTLPNEATACDYPVGAFVQVTLGRRVTWGVVLSHQSQPQVASHKMKPVNGLFTPPLTLDCDLLQLCQWASTYYQTSIGDVLAGVLPKGVKSGQDLQSKVLIYQVTALGQQQYQALSARAHKQQQLIAYLLSQSTGVSRARLRELGYSTQVIKALIEKQWINAVMQDVNEEDSIDSEKISIDSPHALNADQEYAVQALTDAAKFTVFLLSGVTGSGKTEVYMQAMQGILSEGKKVLLLVPEIALTPQTIARIQARFACEVIAYHSKLTDRARLAIWQKSRTDKPMIVIGTRSAIFLPLTQLGMIVLDEEHDLSFKQQTRFRYHARDVAIMRAQFADIPIVLGSATPSIESMCNVTHKRYTLLELSQRAGQAVCPVIRAIDLRGASLQAGLTADALNAIKSQVNAGRQVMVFLNRRGYAPVVMCHVCGWFASCRGCDARMVLHHQQYLSCHHCGSQARLPRICPECRQHNVMSVGVGTQQLVDFIQAQFPEKNIVRIDRDSTRAKGELDHLLTQVRSGEADILVGTQMLAKGHHFPNLSLVVVVDADSGLLGVDFRSTEHFAQLLVQVSGRAGRADILGEVLLQTHHPEHPIITGILQQKPYAHVIKSLLHERKIAHLPPYAFLALLLAKSRYKEEAISFLQEVKQYLASLDQSHLDCLGPVASVMEKKAGFYRAQLLLRSHSRAMLQRVLPQVTAFVSQLNRKRRAIQWTIDVDPQQLH